MFVEINQKYLTPEPPLPFVVCTVGQTTHQGAIVRPEGCPYHHVIWVLEGEGLFSYKGTAFTLSAGEGVFCRRGVPHRYHSGDGPFDTAWFTFLGAEAVLDYYHIGNAFRFTASPPMQAACEELRIFCEGNSTMISRSAAGYSWLTAWLEDWFAPSVPAAVRVRRYLEAHFSEPLTLEQIAAQVRMGKYALCRYYKENQGISVMEQLKRIRLAKARQLLRCSTCNIEEIGWMCGYESPSYFGKLFREATGQSPREYRRLRL